jgi:hypothetical protein
VDHEEDYEKRNFEKKKEKVNTKGNSEEFDIKTQLHVGTNDSVKVEVQSNLFLMDVRYNEALSSN